jgi:hypothetical protein
VLFISVVSTDGVHMYAYMHTYLSTGQIPITMVFLLNEALDDPATDGARVRELLEEEHVVVLGDARHVEGVGRGADGDDD